MDIVFDTSSIINLINGSVFDRIISMSGFKFFIGNQLLEKEVLNDVQKIIIEALISKGRITVLKSEVKASLIGDLKIKYKLGLGETECMALCKTYGMAICTDDLKARNFSLTELGSNELVFGSISLLRQSVLNGTLNCLEVLSVYEKMISDGAFLPKGLNSNYFCK